MTETRETTAQAVLRVENSELDTAWPATDIQLAVEASIAEEDAWQDDEIRYRMSTKARTLCY